MPKDKQPAQDAPAEATDGIDPAASEKAFLSLKPRLLALSQERIVNVSVDMQRVAVGVSAVARKIQEPAVRKRFASLPKDEFSIQHVDDLGPIAWAGWHASVELLTASSTSSEAKLPLSLVNDATAIKQRMIKLCRYNFGDDPVDGPEIDAIVLGTGYQDLAADLARLAKLYKKRSAEVKLDHKNYVASDAANAKKYAQQILELLGEARNVDQKAWTDLTNRAWTLLVEVYGEVSAAGRFLFRNDDPEGRFPSLYSMGRVNVGRPRKAQPGEEDAPPVAEGADNGAPSPV